MVENRPAEYREKSESLIYGPFPVEAEEFESAKHDFINE